MDFELGHNLFEMVALHRLAQLLRDGDDDDGAQIRELGENDGIAAQATASSSSSTSSIEQILQLEENSAAYMDRGKYEEAYGLVKKQYKLGAQVHFAPVLVKYYVTLMQTDRADKAVKIRDELISLLRTNFENSPEDLEKYGDNQRKDSKFFEAILFYQIASELCETEANPATAISALQGCTLGTKLAVAELLEKGKTSKRLIKQYVIPGMRKMKERIGRYKSVDKKLTCLVQGVCLHHTEHCQFLVGDLPAREASIKEAITLLRGILGNEAEKHHLYGGHLNNLGHTYLLTNRPSEAAKVFAQAIAAKQKAEDYDTAAEKREDVQKSQLALQLARRQL